MDWLNYHHLLYFWMVAREGTISRAAKELRLAQPTISGQIRALERSLDQKLFTRVGRNLQLTETGQLVYRYADEIFTLGRELTETLKGRPSGRPLRLRVGVADVLPKLISRRLLAPALSMAEPVQLVVQEGKTEQLLAELSIHGLDMVLADAPIGGAARVKAYNHPLGECGLTFFAVEEIAARHRDQFPRSLDVAPVLLPTENTMLRRSIQHWLEDSDVRPRIVAEFEDSALMKVFGEQGAGIFPAPTVIEDDVRRHHNVEVVGRAPNIRERFYAITVERRIKHPAVQAISDAAKQNLFDGAGLAEGPRENLSNGAAHGSGAKGATSGGGANGAANGSGGHANGHDPDAIEANGHAVSIDAAAEEE